MAKRTIPDGKGKVMRELAEADLSPGSFYKPLSKEFEDHVNRPAGTLRYARITPRVTNTDISLGATDRFDYAGAVVKETLKKNPKAFFWYGDSTWTVWILNTFAWSTIWVCEQRPFC